jgi:hypothetical protein
VPRSPPAALLPPVPKHRTAPTDSCNADFNPYPLRTALELPCLRRDHARRRTPLPSSTPASLSSAIPRVCRMNPQFQPRPAYLLRQAQSPCVASRSNRTRDHRFTRRLLPHPEACLRELFPQSVSAPRTTDLRYPRPPRSTIQIP